MFIAMRRHLKAKLQKASYHQAAEKWDSDSDSDDSDVASRGFEM